MAVSSKNAPLVAAVLIGSLALGVGITKVTGYWKTEASKVPVKIAEGEFAGMPDPGDIRGSYSFANIEATFGVPAPILAEAFGLSGKDPGEYLAKELETVWEGAAGEWEVGTDAVRLFTSLWTGLPHEPAATTALPSTAVEALLSAGKIDGKRAETLNVVRAGKAGDPAE